MNIRFDNTCNSTIGLPSEGKLRAAARLFQATAILAAACWLAFATEARADLFNVAEDNVTVPPFTNNPAPDGGFSSGSGQIQIGSVTNQWRSPFEGVTGQENDPYTSIQGGHSATYSFAGQQSALQILWGSPDSYNTIEFFNGANLVFTLTGNQLHPITFGLGHDLVNFTDLTGSFTSVVLSSALNAFEFADLFATPVQFQSTPLPAALPLFAASVGIVGFAGWRRRRKQGAA